jgi:sulfur-carrier protein adenylyltransferase/sulfurtransferase
MNITVEELKRMSENNDNFLLLDVRTPEEHIESNMGGVLIPLSELEDRFSELDKNKLIVVYCRSGGRSYEAMRFLINQGFSSVYNLTGGILEWERQR